LWNKKKSGGVKSGQMEWFNSGIYSFAKIVLLILQCEVSLCRVRGTSFLFRETDVLFDEFLESNETIRPHNIPYSPYELMEQMLCERFPACEESDQHHFIFWLLRSSFYVFWRAFESPITCFVFLFEDHTGNTRSHHPLLLSQARNDHRPQIEQTPDKLAVWEPSVHPSNCEEQT
jgi:hypothetical protein